MSMIFYRLFAVQQQYIAQIIITHALMIENKYDEALSYSAEQLNCQFTNYHHNYLVIGTLQLSDKNQFQSQKNQFYQKFLYGTQFQMLINNKLKKVNIFLDPNLENLLWISKKGKAFVIDLAYSKIGISLLNNQQFPTNIYGLSLQHLTQTHVFAFQSQKQRKQTYRIMTNYIFYIKIFYKNSINRSRMIKTYAQYDFLHGSRNAISKEQILNIASLQFSNKSIDQYRKILDQCIAKFGTSQNQLSNTIKNAFSMIISCPDQLQPIYQDITKIKISNNISKLARNLDIKTFELFLRQQQQLNEKQVKKIVNKYKDKLSFYDFCQYIQNENLNYAVVPPPINPNLPLNDYFCYSSHNTYLTGNQLTSQSKAQRYSQDLLAGIKCVQIDAHNNGDNIMVTHALKGWSLSRAISLEQVLKTIDDVTDTFQNYSPIILSIEDHTTKDLQHKMSEIILRNFNKKLHIFHGKDKQIHTLKQMKGHILLKSSALIQKVSKSMSADQELPKQLTKNLNQIQKIQGQTDLQYAKIHREFLQHRQKGLIKKRNFNKQFAQLSYQFLPIKPMAKITSLFKVKSISDPTSSSYQCCSKSIGSLPKYSKESLISYTKRSWLRIYPQGSEIFSNNYGICYPLSIGAQIIALNTQTTDDNEFMLQSYFISGRNQNPYQLGYVQKPQHLRSTNTMTEPKQFMKIQVQILSKIIQKPTWKFYSVGNSYPIEKISSLGQTFTTDHPNESFLIIKLSKYQDCLPLRFVKAGIRVITLRNQNFEPIGENLIAKISIQRNFQNLKTNQGEFQSKYQQEQDRFDLIQIENQ